MLKSPGINIDFFQFFLSVLPDLLLSAVLAEGGPGQGAHRGALCLLRKDHDSQGPGATVFHSAPYGT